jgi:hypothetical protein
MPTSAPSADRRDEFWGGSALTRHLESARGHGNRDPKLAAVDFGSEKRPRDRYRQSADQPSRRQHKTVSGWTMIGLSRHWGQQRESQIQNSRFQR